MRNNNANSWDAARVIRSMSEEQRRRVREEIAVRKLACVVLGTPYNRRLLEFAEKRLKEVKK